MTAAATRPAYRTITEIKAANRAAGDHFFDRAQLRLFGTRIVTHVLAGSWFITADHLVPAEAPDFTIHRAQHDGNITTLDGPALYHNWPTLAAARGAVRSLALAAA
jgi:hypothetical protein